MRASRAYQAIFFDWDGTAVTSRVAPPDPVIAPMKALLSVGVPLVIISGTTYSNIAQGQLERYFTSTELTNLFLGLGRGAHNLRYDADGRPYVWKSCVPDKAGLRAIHAACFDIHAHLLDTYDLPTDIVFTRPNYCKIDLMVDTDRADQLFMQGSEIDALIRSLEAHGVPGGVEGLLQISAEIGQTHGLDLAVTCDAKYLEVGLTTKSHNVDAVLGLLQSERGIIAQDCCFWGDEFVSVDASLFGSDSFMITETSVFGDFYDVSDTPGDRPTPVVRLGGGVDTFHQFLREQSALLDR